MSDFLDRDFLGYIHKMERDGVPDELINETIRDELDTQHQIWESEQRRAEERYWNGLDPDDPNDDL